MKNITCKKCGSTEELTILQIIPSGLTTPKFTIQLKLTCINGHYKKFLKQKAETIDTVNNNLQSYDVVSGILMDDFADEDEEETEEKIKMVFDDPEGFVPAIPPDDYKGSQADWMIALQQDDWWDGEGWYGDVQIPNKVWWEILEACEGEES